MLQEVSPEERNGLLPGCLRPANPDKRSADDARKVDRWEPDAGKGESAWEKWVRVDSPHSTDLRDADLLHAQKRYAVRARREVPPKVLEALARTKYTTLVEVYDYVDLEEMRHYVDRNGDQQTETAVQQG